jgi:hypothetical protein
MCPDEHVKSLPVGRHSLATDRRKPSLVLGSVVAPAAALRVAGDRRKILIASVIGAAAFLAAAGGGGEHPVTTEAKAVVDDVTPFALEVVAAPIALASATPGDQAGTGEVLAASRYRVIDRALPAGVAPERGLQVRTILAARAISAAFPEIHNIGGMRPDALRWHPDGLALDVMIPNPGSPEGIALGNQIVSYALANKDRFDLQDCIWRGVYYTPGGAKPGGYGHFDHVHVTTHGGGYPSGSETYFR